MSKEKDPSRHLPPARPPTPEEARAHAAFVHLANTVRQDAINRANAAKRAAARQKQPKP